MKEKVFKIIKYITFLTGIIQLALSQHHISVITKVFATSIGFFLFLFIISSLVVSFNAASLKAKSNMILVLGSNVVAILTGLKYLQLLFADIATGNIVTLQDALNAIIFTVIALIVYAVGLVVIPLTKPEK